MKLKMVVASVAGVWVALAAMAGVAFADCVNVSRPDTANVRILAHSPSLSNCGFAPCSPHLPFDQALLILFEAPPGSFYAPGGLGLCVLGAQYLVGQIRAAAALPGSSIDLTWVVSGEALQSGGVFNNASNPRAQQNLTNGKGIDLLLQNPEISAVINNIEAAKALC